MLYQCDSKYFLAKWELFLCNAVPLCWKICMYIIMLFTFLRYFLKLDIEVACIQRAGGRSNLPCGHSCLPQPYLIVVDNMLNVNFCLFSKNVHYISSYCSFSSNTYHLGWAEMVWLVKVIEIPSLAIGLIHGSTTIIDFPWEIKKLCKQCCEYHHYL